MKGLEASGPNNEAGPFALDPQPLEQTLMLAVHTVGRAKQVKGIGRLQILQPARDLFPGMIDHAERLTQLFPIGLAGDFILKVLRRLGELVKLPDQDTAAAARVRCRAWSTACSVGRV